MNPDTSKRITPAEISQRLGLCRTTISAMLQRGDIPALRTPGGGKWLISRVRYEDWERSFGRSAAA